MSSLIYSNAHEFVELHGFTSFMMIHRNDTCVSIHTCSVFFMIVFAMLILVGMSCQTWWSRMRTMGQGLGPGAGRSGGCAGRPGARVGQAGTLVSSNQYKTFQPRALFD